ncbi:MAG: galactarate dehydratase, partial [Burkholderiaceae bacterium]
MEIRHIESGQGAAAVRPLYIKMHPNDNVAIVVNDGGLPAGTEFPGEFVLKTRVPQGH